MVREEFSNYAEREKRKVKKIGEIIVNAYIVLMFTLLPLYFSNHYFNILHDKRDVYLLISLGLIAMLAAVVLIWLAVSFFRDKSSLWKALKSEYRSVSLLDEMVLAFALLALLSAKLSRYPASSYYGEVAWDVGGQTIFIATLVYFIISRAFGRKVFIWFFVYMGSFAAVLLGVLDRLGYDILLMHKEIERQYALFISTIGNVNIWSGYLSLLVPFYALAPLFLKNRYSRLAAYLFVYMAYFSCFITYSDTCYIGIGTGMLYGVYYSLRKKFRMKNLSVNMILFAVAGLTADILRAARLTPRAIDVDQISQILLQYKLYAVIGVAGIALLLFCIRSEGLQEKVCKVMSRIWIGMILLGVCGVTVYIAVNFSMWLFNYRGTIWYFSWKGYLDGSVKDKIIGAGPGLLDSVTQVQLKKADFEVVWNWYYNTAHNDLLEYLVTTGLLGAVLKILIYILPFTMMKKGEECPAEKAALLAALTGYIGQGLTTGPYILTYVLYMVFLAVYARYCRR